MFDKELIQKVCDLTCSKKDIVRNQTTIKYDTNQPFKKYYNGSVIIGAIKKYTSNEWDDQTLKYWACIYCWILCGGFDDNIVEELNSLEDFFKEVITWDLDGLSFLSSDDDEQDMSNDIKIFEAYDYIWQTRKEWKAVYSMIGSSAKENNDQYVALINDTSRKYMIIHSNHLDNGFEDEYFKFVTQKDYISLIEQLKNNDYQILSCSEDFYYSEISDL